MSSGKRHPIADAAPVAHAMIAELAPFCDRIEIAGSIRRAEVEVGDIEIVAISKGPPRIPALFADMDREGDPPLHAKLDRLLDAQEIRLTTPRRWGTKYRSFVRLYEIKPGGPLIPFKFDVFMTTPEAWPVIMTIRTGDRGFSQWLVSSRQPPGRPASIYWGGLPAGYNVADGRLLKNGRPVDLEDEGDLFKEIGLPWISPAIRTRDRGWYKALKAAGIE